jgi:alpha-mannosidase
LSRGFEGSWLGLAIAKGLISLLEGSITVSSVKGQEAKTVEQAYDLNQPAIAVAGGKPGSLLSKASVDRSNVVLETIKCAESGHGIIIRMYESENALTKTNLVVEGNYNKAFVCNLLEEEEAELELKDGVVCVQLKPYEVVTVKLV